MMYDYTESYIRKVAKKKGYRIHKYQDTYEKYPQYILINLSNGDESKPLLWWRLCERLLDY